MSIRLKITMLPTSFNIKFQFVVIGNKIDIPNKFREVIPSKAQKWCEEKNYCYFECSAKVKNWILETTCRSFQEWIKKATYPISEMII